MGIYTKEEQFELIRENPNNLEKIDNQYDDICLEAVKKDKRVIKYVKNQTHDICMIAFKRYQYAFEYIREQTPQLCLEFVKYKPDTIKKIKNKTPELCFYAFLQDNSLLRFKYIENGIEKYVDNKNTIENNIFCIEKYKNPDRDFNYFDINSLIYLKDFLLKENANNTYILDTLTSNEYPELLKELVVSNNKLLIVDDENITDMHRKLANKIITVEELKKESF